MRDGIIMIDIKRYDELVKAEAKLEAICNFAVASDDYIKRTDIAKFLGVPLSSISGGGKNVCGNMPGARDCGD